MIRIALFTTGGTIDGADSDKGITRETSDAAKWLSNQGNIQFSERSLFNKDSREITNEDHAAIIEAVRTCTDDCILITHGTFTIAETGKLLKRDLGNINKTILLVGSWVPFSELESDAPNQMSFALNQLKTGVKGIYIAMDNRLWDPDKTAKKETKPGHFELAETGV